MLDARGTSWHAFVMFLGSLTSFAEVEAASDRFEALLRALSVEVRVGGELERLLLVVKELVDLHRAPSPRAPRADLLARFRELAGISQIIDLALAAPLEKLRLFARHFDLLNVGHPLQNVSAPRNDPSSDKILELLVGLACLRIGADVLIDDPVESRGDNPDVLATFQATQWGFACKCVSGDAPATLFERIVEGIEQIERSSAERGFVVLSFKNRFDHDAAMPNRGVGKDGDFVVGTHRSTEPTIAALKEFNRRRLDAAFAHASQRHVVAAFRDKKALPCVLIPSQTTIGLLVPVATPRVVHDLPTITRVGFLHLVHFEKAIGGRTRFEERDLSMLELMTRALGGA